jgi:hypothetical protein
MAPLTTLIPILSLAVLVAAMLTGVGTWIAVLCAAALMATVIVAVPHS